MMKKVLIVGANGYVGVRLTYRLAEKGIKVIAFVRNLNRLKVPSHLQDKIEVIEGDLLQRISLNIIPDDIDCAYYFVHSLSSKNNKFFDLEAKSAENFVDRVSKTQCKKIVYLSGLSGKNPKSEHMKSRSQVGEILSGGLIPVVNLQAGIIIGSGSASFELMRDLVEKLPVMIAPRWINSKCQPIGISDVLYYLDELISVDITKNTIFEIGGPDKLSYKEMMKIFSEVRGLKRWFISVPVLTPRLSSLWLVLVTSSNLYLAKRLIESLRSDAICSNNDIEKMIPHKCLSYKETIGRAFDKIEQNHILSSWKDAVNKPGDNLLVDSYIQVPEFGCLNNIQIRNYTNAKEKILSKLWAIGGNNGWYYMNWAWRIRGVIDKLVGGVGLRRGRRSPKDLEAGDALDFWRVVKSNKETGELILYAEMKLPGEAWLSWDIKEIEGKVQIKQIATFRPKGLFGRIYWYSLWPVHLFIFKGLCNKIGRGD
ncbi:MAG: hypothetical protein S4CHLAM20_10780 [Chlamydiia bacterium]|nr:hypothetical protein [Chlamydiia bacterium]